MRVAEENPTKLVLRDATSWISWMCWLGAALTAADAAQKKAPLSLILPALCIMFGVAFFRNSTITFDKLSRCCRVRRRDVWRLTSKDVPFGAITGVRVQAAPGDDSRTTTTYRLTLQTSGGEVPLSTSYQPGQDRFEQMRASILGFMSNAASATPSSDPAIDLVHAGRRIDAIALLRRRDGLRLDDAKRKVEAMANGLNAKRA